MNLLTDQEYEAQANLLRLKPPLMPATLGLVPWVVCSTLKLEYVPGADYVWRGLGRAFHFGAVCPSLIYSGVPENGYNILKVCQMAWAQIEDDWATGKEIKWELVEDDGVRPPKQDEVAVAA